MQIIDIQNIRLQNMKYNTLLLLALLCLSSIYTQTTCPGFYDRDLLQSGKVSFMRSRSNNRQFTYENPISFAIPNRKQLQVAASAGTIGDYDPSRGGFSFEISGRRKPNRNFVEFTLIAPSDGWTSIQVSYLVSSRDDFAVGNYQFPINTWGRTNNNDIYDLTYNINKALPSDDYSVAAFISGFSTTDNQFQISINQRSYNQRSRTLTFSLFCSASPRPSSITISYVIYPKNHQTLDIFYGSPMADMGSYQISGPTSFPTSNIIEYNEFRVGNRYLVCSGNQCGGSMCLLREDCIERGGNAYEGQCIFCATGIVFEYGLCTRRCRANQVYTQRVCICAPGYTRKGNQCIIAGQDCNRNSQIKYNNGCRKCPGGSSPNNDQSTCICRNGLTYDINSNKCKDSCGNGEFYDDRAGRCVCLGNFGRDNRGICVQCPPGATSSNQRCVCPSNQGYNSQTNQCNVNCAGNQVWNGNRCTCPSNQIFINDNCRQCPTNSNPNNAQTTCQCTRNGETYDSNSNRCVSTVIRCPKGQVLFQGQCVCDGFTSRRTCRQCPAGSKPDYAANTCICAPGSTFDANRVQCVSNCATNQVFVNDKCACIDGFSRFNGVCRQCPKSSTAAKDDSTCNCISKNAIYIGQSNLCVDCGANSVPNSQKTACICSQGYRSQGSICVPDIQCEWNQQLVNGQCQCKFGFQDLGGVCVEICGLNQYYDGDKCLCKEGHAYINGVCRKCPPGSSANTAKTACLCDDPLSYFILSSNGCTKCPSNSLPNNDDTDCICNAGYTKSGASCISTCPSDALPNDQGQCICSGGKIFSAGQCVTPIQCPDRSVFNSTARACVCTVRGQNFIDGVCQPCIANSVWDGQKCVCSTGYFLIGAECRTCDPRTKYNGKDCICNLGYFGNRDLCTPCHKSCSQCTGPQADKCTACADISLVLQKGYCTKNSPCGFGFFVDNGGCSKCLDNCIDCDSIFECRTCGIGYAVKPQTVGGQTVKSCEEICGDGIKYQQRCDDGNTNNGDGCNSKCQEQPGWFCSGGSSNKPSTCKKVIPDQVQLSARGAVSANGYILQGIKTNYLPECITKNQCQNCFKVLDVKVVNANFPVTVIVDYVPFTQYQWTIKFDFQGLFVTSILKVVIKLNEEFRGCIADQDYNEQLQLEIDPVFLAKIDVVEKLSLEAISLVDNNARVVVPAQARAYLGI